MGVPVEVRARVCYVQAMWSMRTSLPAAFRPVLLLAAAFVCWRGATVSGQSPASGLEFVHTGLCDASAGVALDADHFAVADDENNTLCVYRNDRSGPALVVS